MPVLSSSQLVVRGSLPVTGPGAPPISYNPINTGAVGAWLWMLGVLEPYQAFLYDESVPLNTVGKRPTLINSHCLTMNGTQYLSAAHIIGTEAVVSKGGTSTVTLSPGRINFTSGTCWDLVLSNGDRFPFAEGSGATVYNVVANRHATINSAGSNWSATQNLFHWNLSYGFALSSGVKIPAIISKTSSAIGTLLTNPAGPWHNYAETKINFLAPYAADANYNSLLPNNYAVGGVLPAILERMTLYPTTQRECKFSLAPYNTVLTRAPAPALVLAPLTNYQNKYVTSVL